MSSSPPNSNYSDPMEDDHQHEEDEVQLMHEAFVGALVSNGVLGKLRAQLRTAALGIVRDDARRVNVFKPNKPPSQLNESEKIATLLVADLLSTSGYNCSESIFEEEATLHELGEPSRDQIYSSLNLGDSAEPLPSAAAGKPKTPVLVHLISQLLQGTLTTNSNGDNSSPSKSSKNNNISSSSSSPNQQPTLRRDANSDADLESMVTGTKSGLNPRVIDQNDDDNNEEEAVDDDVEEDSHATSPPAVAKDHYIGDPEDPPPRSNTTTTTAAAPATSTSAADAKWNDDSIAYSDYTNSQSLESGDEYDIVDEAPEPTNVKPDLENTTTAQQGESSGFPTPAATAPQQDSNNAAVDDDDDDYAQYDDFEDEEEEDDDDTF